VSLLELRHVRKHRARGSRRVEVPRDVSLEVDAGELVAVWSSRRSGRSGRSTLLAVAAGVEPPDSGLVLFEGKDLSASDARMLGEGVGYCAHGVNAASRRG
jgi:predicted ABC-type transport system involved in lysophospholipase L1 biosynthesis ATPase subunit